MFSFTLKKGDSPVLNLDFLSIYPSEGLFTLFEGDSPPRVNTFTLFEGWIFFPETQSPFKQGSLNTL